MRTKSTARKSKGGRPPIRIPPGPHFHRFPDRTGRPYTVVTYKPYQVHSIPKLGIQLYCIGDPNSSPENLGAELLTSDPILTGSSTRSRWPRVDVFTGFTSVEECMEHYRQEKLYRQAATRAMRQNAVAGLSKEEAEEKLINEVRGKEPWPHIMPTWCETEQFWHELNCSLDRYRSWILVVPQDRHSWEEIVEKGLLRVSFDLDVTPTMLTIESDEDVDEDTCLDGELYGWVYVDWSGYEKYTPVKIQLLCVRKDPDPSYQILNGPPEREHQYFHGWTPGSDERLVYFWGDAVSSLHDCTYSPICDDCYYMVPHDVCENQLNEHFYDNDGQCIACRRAREYRRRSKRIAAKAQKKSNEH